MQNQTLIITDTYRKEEKEEYKNLKEIASSFMEKVITPNDMFKENTLNSYEENRKRIKDSTLILFLLQDVSIDLGIKLQMAKELNKKMMWITKNGNLQIPFKQAFSQNIIASHTYLESVTERKEEIEEDIKRYMIDKEIGISYVQLKTEELRSKVEKELIKWTNLKRKESTNFDFYTITYNTDNVKVTKESYNGKPIATIHFLTKDLSERQKELTAQYCYIYFLKIAQMSKEKLTRAFLIDNVKQSKAFEKQLRKIELQYEKK